MANDENGHESQSAPDEATSRPGRDMAEQVDKLIPEEDAPAAGLVIGGMLAELDAEEDADLPPSTTSSPSKVTSSRDRDLERMKYDDYHGRSDARDRRFQFLWLILIILGVAAVAAALMVLRGEEPSGSGTTGSTTVQNATAAAPIAPAQPTEAADDAGTADGCLVPATSLRLENVETRRSQGVNDPNMFVVQWETQVTNSSDAPILVQARFTSSQASDGVGWDPNYERVQPAATIALPSNFVTNNGGGFAGPTTWHYADRIVAVVDTPECQALLSNPLDEAATIPVALPSLPANAEVPAG